MNPTDPQAAAMNLMQQYLDALNQRDQQALVGALHFPHYRLTDGVLKVWETEAAYFQDFLTRAGGEWHHTRWGRLECVQAGDNKVHLDVQVDRYREDDSLIISFRSLWVIACIDGRWGAQLRSSFAPDAKIIAASEH